MAVNAHQWQLPPPTRYADLLLLRKAIPECLISTALSIEALLLSSSLLILLSTHSLILSSLACFQSTHVVTSPILQHDTAYYINIFPQHLLSPPLSSPPFFKKLLHRLLLSMAKGSPSHLLSGINEVHWRSHKKKYTKTYYHHDIEHPS